MFSSNQWVIWNDAYGILAMATIGRVETTAAGRQAWLDQPFDMVGPINLDELETQGRLAFAACIVMSRQRWQSDQGQLRQEAFDKRRASQQRLHEANAQFNKGWYHRHTQFIDERGHRATLNLPADGQLEPSQIKKAFRRLAQKMHPDVGGSHEQFLRIAKARDALLEIAGEAVTNR